MPERTAGVLLLCLFLAGCSGSANSGASGPAQTPTSSRYFSAVGVLSLPTPTRAAATGIPTHSPLFNGPGRTVTPSQPPTSAGTATVSTFFQASSPILTPSPATRPTGAPTASNLFVKNSGSPFLDLTMTPASPDSGQSAPAQGATPTATLTPTSDPAANPSELKTIPVYNGVLTAGWGLENSWGIDQAEDSTVLSPAGGKSIRFSPKEDYGTLFFTVEKNGSAKTN